VGGALAVSALTALAVSWYVSRRLQRSVTEVASAATAVAHGRYDTRVSSPRLGDDFDTLTEAFNQMAARLQTVDATRRQLFGDLAHEIRTPVAVLEAYMEALEDGVRSLNPATTTMLREQTRRLVRFSEDVAALAQAEESSASMAFTWIDPHELVTSAVAAAQESYHDKRVALAAAFPDDLPRLWGDPQRLAQILGNILDNALRHTPEHGHVEVRADASRDQLTVRVVDTGDGIPAEHLPHVFERFYRIDAARSREHGGAGIGLAIAKALAEAHGGHITAISDGPGAGATFTITLPLRPAGTVQAASVTNGSKAPR
jgi:signal transduction histidine kinase